LPDQRMKPAANISKARQQFSLSLEERAGVRWNGLTLALT
jgi:hypothetical protein